MEPITLREVAELVGGRLVGDGDLELRGVAPLDDAGPDDLGLLADRRYLPGAGATKAGALLVGATLEGSLSPSAPPYVAVDDPHGALVELLGRLYPPAETLPGIHRTAVVGVGVTIGSDVSVGPYAVVEDGCVLGDRSRVGAHVVLGRGSRVGEDSVLHPHVTLYPGTVLGRRVILHSGSRVGVDGFGYAPRDGTFEKIPQIGGCVLEDDVEVGANSCIDRGSIGETRIGAGVKLDNLIHIAHNVRIGPHSAFAAQVGIAGSTRVGTGVVIGGQAGAVGHIEIGDGAQVGAQGGIIGDVPAGARVTGYPARDVTTYMRASAHFLRLPELSRRVRRLEQSAGDPSDSAKMP